MGVSCPPAPHPRHAVAVVFALTVLGAATPYPRPDAACSGYLLRAAGSTVWVDAGPGTHQPDAGRGRGARPGPGGVRR